MAFERLENWRISNKENSRPCSLPWERGRLRPSLGAEFGGFSGKYFEGEEFEVSPTNYFFTVTRSISRPSGRKHLMLTELSPTSMVR